MPHHAYKIKSEVFSVLRAKLLQSCLTLFETLWTVVCQASLSMGFSRQEYWSGHYSLLQGIFPTQRLNLGLLHCRQILYHLSHQGSPSQEAAAFKKGVGPRIGTR